MKYAWIKAHGEGLALGHQYPVARLCRLLQVSRSGYTPWRARPPSNRALANATLDAQIATIHAESRQSYGRPRILRELDQRGIRTGHERVRRSLKRQCLRPVYKRPYRVTTDSNHAKPVAKNVLDRGFDGWMTDQAWVADITYVSTGEGWLYLACVLDLGSRKIVGWSMSERMKASLVCDALTMAYWRRKPSAGMIMHSDRGAQYASDAHCKLIKEYRMIQSRGWPRAMSRKANCWDNSVMESFFKTLKVERVHRLRYPTRAQARLDLVDWMEGFYGPRPPRNSQRLHSSIDYQSPTAFERSLKTAHV